MFRLIALLAIAAIAASSSSKSKKKAKPAPGPNDGRTPIPGRESECEPGWIDMGGGECLHFDDLDETPSAGDTAYGFLQDAETASEALMLLGFGGLLPQATAAFQEHAYYFFDLDEGKLRTDGTLDPTTISLIYAALQHYKFGSWMTPSDAEAREAMLNAEYDNAETLVLAWAEDPSRMYVVTLPNAKVLQAPHGMPTATWITNYTYWMTYNVGGPDSPAPVFLDTTEGSEAWNAEINYHAAWDRIYQYVTLFMEDRGIPNAQIFP